MKWHGIILVCQNIVLWMAMMLFNYYITNLW